MLQKPHTTFDILQKVYSEWVVHGLYTETSRFRSAFAADLQRLGVLGWNGGWGSLRAPPLRSHQAIHKFAETFHSPTIFSSLFCPQSSKDRFPIYFEPKDFHSIFLYLKKLYEGKIIRVLVVCTVVAMGAIWGK